MLSAPRSSSPLSHLWRWLRRALRVAGAPAPTLPMTFPGARRVAKPGGSVNAPSRLIQTPGFEMPDAPRRPRHDWTENRHHPNLTEIDPPHLLTTSDHTCPPNRRLLTIHRSSRADLHVNASPWTRARAWRPLEAVRGLWAFVRSVSASWPARSSATWPAQSSHPNLPHIYPT